MILKIFKRDMKKIFTNSLAIILAIGVAILPSLYAWINIYANWDPYGPSATSNMQIAVMIEDEGYSYKDVSINVGDEIEKNLKANDKINWVFCDYESGLEGVKSSKYYAAIHVPKGFSKSFASILTSNFAKPQITYYANEKKNAIATKITDKVVQTVQTEVNESFVTTVVDLIEGVLGVVVDDVDTSNSDNVFNALGNELEKVRGDIKHINTMVDGFSKIVDLSSKLTKKMTDKDLKEILGNAETTVQDTEDVIKITSASINSIVSSLDVVLSDTSKTLSNLSKDVEDLSGKPIEEIKAVLTDVYGSVSEIEGSLSVIIEALEIINDSLPEPLPALTAMIVSLKDVDTTLLTLKSTLDTAIHSTSVETFLKKISSQLSSASTTITELQKTYKSDIKPKLENTVNSVLGLLVDVSNILSSIDKDEPVIKEIIDTLNGSLSAGDDITTSLSELLKRCNSFIDVLSDELSSLSENEILNAFINLTAGNKEEMGAFIACPVDIETEKVYAFENYGSAMAPFYSTLAIWVGAVILVSLLKTKVKNKKELGKVKPYHEYFGRGLTFVLFSFVQAIIVCLGDLLFLGVQCYHPFLFVLSGAIGSIVFSFLVYSFVVALGDIGKAIAVILLVIQLGGSGGTFPIDVTPKFFRVIHPYLPFTFVIDAMRECMCGSYGADYWIDMLKLLAYLVVALFFGFFVRWIFKNPVKLFSKKVEETGIF